MRGKRKTKKQKNRKIAKVLSEFKKGTLDIGKSKKKVKRRKQAIAIALSVAGKSNKRKRKRKSKAAVKKRK